MNSRQAKPVPKRRYRSALRAEQADQTRRRLLDAAAACFAENGYAGTTMKAIADRAGVSVETVQLNGPKADLLLAAYEQTFAGDEGQHSLMERDSFQHILEISDPSEGLDALVDFMAAANARSARLGLALESAAQSDPKVAEMFRALGERARADSRAGLEVVEAKGALPTARPRKEVADELWFVLKDRHYLYLVEDAGWSERQYKAWLRRTLRALLLEP